MSTPTRLYLPSTLAYPVTIVKHLVTPSPPSPALTSSTSSARPWTVKRGTPLFTYAVLAVFEEGKGKDKEIRTFESPVEGDLVAWRVQPGQAIHAASEVVAEVLEPCSHPKQFHGMCAECGAELTDNDYLGFSDLARAPVRMSHDDAELTVSLEEANRLEKETSDRLRKERKLSLIVDLDQTVIHATVDPTVGDWKRDANNPNHAVLQNVSAFKLGPDGALAAKEAEQEGGCWYYVKMRPGLQAFLTSVSDIYEMHVYTMGTRNYAAAVCEIIDPDGRYFGGRILSRDESGSLTQKSLNRLFPCDTSMVVIIDDRADVWEWSPNLVKVIPYDFFVGIGDINGAFLPKRAALDMPASPKAKEPSTALEGGAVESAPAISTGSSEAKDGDAEGSDEKTAARRQAAAETQTQVLADQVHDRPLQKKQEALHAVAVADKKEKDARSTTPPPEEAPPSPSGRTTVPLPETSESDDETVIMEEAVLKDDDRELDRVLEVLKRVHDDYYTGVDGARDVKVIIPDMKRAVLDGVGILFSGVIPLNVPPHRSEIWRLATQFGATCLDKLDRRVSHVVTAKSDTAKVNSARLRKDVTIVWASWLSDSIALWRRQREEDYAVDIGPSTLPLPTKVDPDPPPIPTPPTIEDDIDVDAVNGEEGSEGAVELDWDDADRELEDMLNETDSDTEGPNKGKKRARSRSASLEPIEGAKTGSPLSKRQKMASNRKSKLKIAHDAEGVVDSAPPSGGSRASDAGSDEDFDGIEGLADFL